MYSYNTLISTIDNHVPLNNEKPKSMRFYNTLLSHIDNHTQPNNRNITLMRFARKQFPILFQRYPDQLSSYMDGSLAYSQILPLLARIKSDRILQMDEGRVRSNNYILGLRDPVLAELTRFKEAFGPGQKLRGERVPGTGIIQNSTQHRVKTFLC
ncbi:hypothetical protein K2X92_04995 [Candidatus Gracilibacteria bacterium]|nr:hypothetical protein [Candidatus Gracilibacteria bacterium]